MRRTSLLALMFLAMIGLFPPSAMSFFDSFEGEEINAFWSPKGSFAPKTVLTSDVVHSGSRSLKTISTGWDSVGAKHRFSRPRKGIISIWVYDNYPNVRSRYLLLYTCDYSSQHPSCGQFALGTQDWVAGQYGAFAFDDTVAPPWRPRSVGWHKFELRFLDDRVEFILDAELIRTKMGSFFFDYLDIEAGGWQYDVPVAVYYFDDFYLSDVTTANAGPDLLADEESTVTLDGSGSTVEEGKTLAYSWTQVAGPAVSLDFADPVHPTFTAPIVESGGETLTFSLLVNDGTTTSEADYVNVTVSDVNHAPVAATGLGQTVAEESPVTLDGTRSYDPDGSSLTFTWTQTSGPVVTLDLTDQAKPMFTAPYVGVVGETLTFSLVVNDGALDSTPSEVAVFVENTNHAPIANAGADQTRDEGAIVGLNGTASSDPDEDSLTYRWTQISGTPVDLSDRTAADPTFVAPPVGADGDTLVFELAVSDGIDVESQVDLVNITVLDTNQPPQCGLAVPDVGLLWPPNHKLLPVGIAGVSDPEDAGVTIVVTGVTQDEPVEGLGEGDTSPDALLESTALLRAERRGNGNGRVYHVNFTATDTEGKSCAGSVAVCVPKDARTSTCVDDGILYESATP